MKTLSTVLFLVLAATALAACSHTPAPENTPEPAQMDSVSPAMEESATTPDDSSGAMVVDGKIAVAASNFKYDVAEIKVKAGEPLTISVTNDEGFHDFKIDELEVDSGMIPAGETKELVIPTDKPGTYEFYCSVGEHRKMGMKGMLVIE